MVYSKKRLKRKKHTRIPVKKRRHDKSLLILIGGMLLFGIAMIYDSTAIYSHETLGSAYKLVIQQVVWLVVGFFGFSFFYNIGLERLRKMAFPLFMVALGFLALLSFTSVFFECGSTGFVPCINGARRWFYLNPAPLPSLPFVGVLGFQPSEFMKFALILYFAVILEKKIKEKASNKDVFTTYAVVAGLVTLLVLLQPNMSTAILLLVITTAMFFASGANLSYLYLFGPPGLIASIGLILSSDYRRQRFLTLISPDKTADLASGYHIKQVLIALGSGGFWGVGFGKSRQKYQYIPEVAADSIFAIIGEELGFIGTSLLVLLFGFLIYKGFMIARNCNDLLGRLLAVGITTWIAFQFFINIAAMTRIIPLTGVPMPLVSYGGSSLVFSLMGLGLLANISRRS